MYKLDTQAARKADAGSSFIKEIGKYVGEFTQVEDITAKTGARGIGFSFEANDGQKADFQIYTQSAQGEKYSGFDALMTIMTCMSLKNIEPKAGKVTHYDYDAKADVTKDAQIFPELMKPIGILLETEDYINQSGDTKTKMVLKNVFQADTELTASEILDRKTKPEKLEGMVAALRHRPAKGAKPLPARTSNQPAPVGMDDDSEIPF